MKYITNFFNKNPEEINLEDIENFFSEEQIESSTLELKSGEVEINDVIKEIAAFLNTEGGLIIIGAPRETKKADKTSFCKGEPTYSKFASKDWLTQKIFSNITPSPTDIFIKQIKSSSEGNIFLIDIPQSSRPPHQSNADGRYYIRMESMAKPAPHGLVLALFDKRRKPKLYSTLKRTINSQFKDTIYVSIRNDTKIPTEKVSYLIDLYNVIGTEESNFRSIDDELSGKKLSLEVSLKSVLVSFISSGNNFQVHHSGRRYIVAVHYYSIDCDFDCTYYIVDPTNNSIISHNWLDENQSLIDSLKELYN